MAKKSRSHQYTTYRFIEKDPVIDALRTVVEDVGLSYTQISQDCNVSMSTLGNWFGGKTRKPQFATISAVALALGARGIAFVKGKPHFTGIPVKKRAGKRPSMGAHPGTGAESRQQG